VTLINFTVEYDLLAAVTDTDGSGSDADIVPLTGPVTFTPVFGDNKAVLAPGYEPRPAGLKLLPISGYLDTDGRLKDSPGGTVGVRLPANDPVLELSQLSYQVRWDVHTTSGEPVKVDPGFIDAPSEDSTVNLADALASTAAVSSSDAITVARVATLVNAATPAIVDAAVEADLAGRDIGVEEASGGTAIQFTLGGDPLGDEISIPSATWSGTAGKPVSVTDAGVRSRAALTRLRPGIPRRILAPGGLSALDDLIRVYYDGNKFFTDYDVTVNRHTGTAFYSDRENGSFSNSGRATTLTAALTAGTAVTSLTVAALPAEFTSGTKIVVFDQDAHGTWHSMVATLSATASASATSVSVNSVTPGYSFGHGAVVASPKPSVFSAYQAAAAGDQVIILDRTSNSYGGVIDRQGGWGFGEMALSQTGTTSANLSTGSPITSIACNALTVAVTSGSNITLESGANTQTFTLTSTANVGATTIAVASQEPNYAYPSGTSIKVGNRIAKSITIAAQFPGEPKLVIGNWHGTGATSEWALKSTYDNVYICTQVNTTKVVDTSVGEIMEYTKVADANACEAAEGTWYVSGSEVGVHPVGGGAPDPTAVFPLMLYSDQAVIRNENGNMTCYLADFTIIGGGGQGGIFAEGINTDTLDLYCHRMNFYSNVANDSVNVNGARYVVFQDCKSAFSVKDGFNYSVVDRNGTTNADTIFLEINCESWAHGLGNTVAGFENVSNASTAHIGVEGLRIGGYYHDSVGAVIADVQSGCETWTVGCDVWGSLSAVDGYDVTIDAQQSGVVMHVYGCRAWGSAYDLLARSGTTMNVYDTEADVQLVFGTLNTLSSI